MLVVEATAVAVSGVRDAVACILEEIIHNAVVRPDKPSLDKRKIAKSECFYVVSQSLVRECSKIDKIGPRSFLVHSLMASCKVLNGLTIFPVKMYSSEELCQFHSEGYVDFLKRCSEGDPKAEDESDEYGFGYDCPVLDDMLVFATTIASASLTAAELLCRRKAKIAINWSGGWHHAKRDSAGGFCYVNDIVLAIHRLQRTFARVLYIDLDVHHGDGVEDAFSSTSKVMTLSLHRQDVGFFPGTGHLTDVGYGRGRYHAVNVPLREGIDDPMYCWLFERVMQACADRFQPEAVVVQCGADCLTGDPLGGFNLTPAAISQCVGKVIDYGVPVLLLGGGGYVPSNAARCWTQVTADILGIELPEDVPEEDKFFLKYGPDYEMAVKRGNMKNLNSYEELKMIIETIKTNLDAIPSS